MLGKTCIFNGCNNEQQKDSRYCREHYLQRKREREAYKRSLSSFSYTKYGCTCIVCGKKFSGYRKTSLVCSPECRKILLTANSHDVGNQYERGHGGGYCFMHRKIAEGLLGPLDRDTVVHHIDGNPLNNSLDNLIVFSRSTHASLHSFLCRDRLLHKFDTEWCKRVGELTDTWLKDNNVTYTKLSEL